jgi:tetratricopeptide (TPR) repeat protein
MTMERSPRRPAFRSLFALGLVLTAASALLAVSGIIKGKVTEGDGKPIKDVRISLKDETRGQTYEVRTDKKGQYYLMGINPAEYKMSFEKPGFEKLEGVVSVVPDKENVFDAVLVPEAPKKVAPAWEEKNLRAHDLYMKGQFAEALALYNEILAVDPGVAFIHFNAGNCSYHLQDYGAAYRSFREAVRLKPDFFEAYTNLANTCARLKTYDEAIPLFEDAIRTYPENGGLYASLGLLYLNQGQGARAAGCLEKAVSLSPDNALAYQSLGIAYTQTGDFARAVTSYEKYLSFVTEPKEVERVKGVIEQLKPLIKK